MPVRFMAGNLVDDATLSSASEATGYPVENVQNRLLAAQWRTGAGASHILDITLGSAQDVSAVVLAGHNLESSDTVTLYYASSPPGYSSAGTFTHDAGNMVLFISTLTYRYWRITIAPHDSGTRSVGRIYLGTYLDTERGRDLNSSREWVDPSTVRRSYSGAVFADSRNHYQECKFKVVDPQSNIDTLQTTLEPLGIHTPLFVCLDTSSPNGDNTIYGTFKNPWRRIDMHPDDGEIENTIMEWL